MLFEFFTDPVRRALSAAALIAVTSGCASHQEQDADCMSLACINKQAALLAFESCRDALHQSDMSKSEQAAVDARYGYPLINFENYAEFVGVGGRGPSPTEWCRGWSKAYARAHQLVGR